MKLTVGIDGHKVAWSIAGHEIAEYNGDDYHTNSRGEGMWKGYQQERGTCDFTLRHLTPAAIRAKIRREFTVKD